MQAWRLRVQDADGHNITLLAALKRYLVAYPSPARLWPRLLADAARPHETQLERSRFGHARGALHPTVTLLPSPGSARLVLSQRPRKKPNP